MDDRTFERWTLYVRSLADELRLRDWAIELTRDDQPDDGLGADVWCVYGQKRAHIRLNRNLFGRTDLAGRLDQRRTILHELLHLKVEPFDESVRLTGESYGDDPRYALFMAWHKRESELLIDDLATAIADRYPTIDEFEEAHCGR